MSDELKYVIENSIPTEIPAAVEGKLTWIPEDYDFFPHRISETVTREDLFYRGNFELRKLNNGYWLCRKKIRNDKGNTEHLVRFYLKINSQDIDIAKYLLTKGLE